MSCIATAIAIEAGPKPTQTRSYKSPGLAMGRTGAVLLAVEFIDDG